MTDLSMRAGETHAGRDMYALIERLYPICRSITGDGVRATLAAVGEQIPLTVHEVPSGTQVFDWSVPDEWNIRDGAILSMAGERIVDFRAHNLHVLNYSEPVDRVVSRDELLAHLHSLPEQPDWIPYRTSYYRRDWGFCVTHRQFEALQDAEYRVFVDATLAPGHLTYGEYVIPGASDEEILISCHVCHPSLCNDNLSGIALATALARRLATRANRYSYRFLFIPGTIGSITWLARNTAQAARIRHGLVVTCVGDGGPFTFKRSRRGDSELDRMVEHVLAASGAPHRIVDFYPYGYDERQYCSPGFDLAVGSLSRSSHGAFPEYHTSADDLELVRPEHLEASLAMYEAVVAGLECNRRYLNLQPMCEPQLGKRGLYGAVGAATQQPVDTMALLWLLNQSDGEHDLLDVARRSGIALAALDAAAHALVTAGLLREAAPGERLAR